MVNRLMVAIYVAVLVILRVGQDTRGSRLRMCFTQAIKNTYYSTVVTAIDLTRLRALASLR